MAISIISEPSQLPSAASFPFRVYQPLVYWVGITGSPNAPACKAQLYINGVAYKSPQTSTHIDYDSLTGTFKFKFDATSLLRDYAISEATWGALNGQTATVAPDADSANTGFYQRILFYFEFTEYIITPPSPTLEPADTVTSTVKQAINAKADTSSVSIYPYAGNFPSLWLSNAPRVGTTTIKEIDLAQGDFLTYFSQGAPGGFTEMAEVKTYDDNSNLIATYYFDVGVPIADANRLRRVGFGPTNLNNTPASQFTVTPTFPIIHSGVYFYEVKIVYWQKAGGGVPLQDLTRLARYYITNGCEKVQLYYNNEFGSDDNLSFDVDMSAEDYKINQTQYNIPIVNIIPTIETRGSQTLTSNAERIFTLRGNFHPTEQARIKELLNSPNLALVFPNNPTKYIKVVNEKTGINRIKNSDEDGGESIVLELVLRQSAKDFSHQN